MLWLFAAALLHILLGNLIFFFFFCCSEVGCRNYGRIRAKEKGERRVIRWKKAKLVDEKDVTYRVSTITLTIRRVRPVYFQQKY